MPRETFISEIYEMRPDEPIAYLRAGVKSVGERRSGDSKFDNKAEWSFEGVTIFDPDYPADTITAMFKDCLPFPNHYIGQIVIFECSKTNTGLKAADDQQEKDGPLERVLWVTRSARIYSEEEGPEAADRKRAPAQESRRPARQEAPAGRSRRREREPEPSRERAPAREPERRETSRRDEPPVRQAPPQQQQPAQQPPQQQPRRHADPSPKLILFQMSLMFIEAHKAAKYAAEQIVLEEQKMHPGYKMSWPEFCAIRSSIAIEGYKKNLHTQLRPPLKPKPEPAPQDHPPEEQRNPPNDILPPEDPGHDDDIPY